jgi:hypothetical protein
MEKRESNVRSEGKEEKKDLNSTHFADLDRMRNR